MKQKLAIFDVDGTLFDGNLGIEFVKTLVKKGIFEKEISEGIFDWYGKYKSGEAEKSVVVDEMYKLFAKGMSGKKEGDMRLVALETWDGVVSSLHDFAKSLVKKLRQQGFRIIILSGSPIEMIKILGKKLEVNSDELIAGVLEIKEGLYTGETISYLGSSSAKIEAINKYIKRAGLDVDWSNSFGMGDNERDLGILDLVGHPFAFEPNEALKVEAKKMGYKIIDRTNTIDSIEKTIGLKQL
jgi:HAD superfamily hydrolase (TIGR01490 family)